MTTARDRGSASITVVIFAIITMGLAGLVIDGGLAISQRERAADIAEQAARRVANNVDVSRLHDTGAAVIQADEAQCFASAQEIAVASGLPADAVSACTPDLVANTVTVGVRIRYRPLLSGMFFTGEFDAHGSATASPVVGATEEGAG